MGAISQDVVWLFQVGRDHFQPKLAHIRAGLATGGRRMKTDKQMHAGHFIASHPGLETSVVHTEQCDALLGSRNTE